METTATCEVIQDVINRDRKTKPNTKFFGHNFGLRSLMAEIESYRKRLNSSLNSSLIWPKPAHNNLTYPNPNTTPAHPPRLHHTIPARIPSLPGCGTAAATPSSLHLPSPSQALSPEARPQARPPSPARRLLPPCRRRLLRCVAALGDSSLVAGLPAVACGASSSEWCGG